MDPATPNGSLPQNTVARDSAAAPRTRRITLIVALAASSIMLWWHASECATRFPTGRVPQTLPFTEFDHPFHFYYTQLTREFFQNRHAFWGYDPAFMAGYAKTLIFPTSSTLAEFVAIAGAESAAAYCAFV